MLLSKIKPQISKAVAIMLFVFSWNFSHAQAPGDLDPSFGTDGKVLFWVGGGWPIGPTCPGAALQPDGKILQFGTGWRVVRYNQDGSLDGSFGNAGESIIALPELFFPGSMLLLPSGKILICGSGGYGSQPYRGVLVRLNSNGAIDTSFGDAGIIWNVNVNFFNALALQEDDKIVTIGSYDNLQNSKFNFAIVRYNSDGSLDNTFNPSNANHIQYVDFGTDDHATSVCIQPDGKIVILGFREYESSPPLPPDFKPILLTRLQSNGAIDLSFGSQGKIITSVIGPYDFPEACAIQSNGKLLVVGTSFLMRLLDNGNLDNTFGNGGITIVPEIAPSDVAFQPDGKIVVCGIWADGNYTGFSVGRFSPDGALDQTFGNAGIVKTDFFGYHEWAEKILVQADGKLVVTGETEYEFALARYLTGLNVGLINPANSGVSNNIYPNPVGQKLTLEYELPEKSLIDIDLLDLSGSLIQQIASEEPRSIGKHKEDIILGDELIHGVYLLRIQAGRRASVLKIFKQ